MLIYARYKDPDGSEKTGIYHDYETYYKDTFSPDCEELKLIELSEKGRTYAERKAYVKGLALDFQSEAPALAWSELAAVQSFFREAGRRCGLLREFQENGIC